MSLINRMLDDLAARQAPGAEALGGVRLAEPLGDAKTTLSARRALLLLALVLVAAALAWLWLRPAKTEAPQVRGLGATAAAESSAPLPPPAASVDAAVAGGGRDATQVAEVIAVESSTTPPAPRMALQLDSKLDLPPLPPPARAESRRIAVAPPAADDARIAIASVPAEAAPRREPPAERRPARAQQAPAAESAPPPPVADLAQQARDALSRGEPQAALDALGPGPDNDTDRAALRAAALQRLGRHEDAASAYGALTRRDPEQATHWVGLAISLEALNRGAEAALAYRRALLDPRLASSLRTFAESRLKATESE